MLEVRQLLSATNPLPLAALDGSTGVRLLAPAGDSSGISVSGAGDVNGDGYDDVIVGAWYAGNSREGAAYIVFGQGTPFGPSFDLLSLNGLNGFRIDGVDGGDYTGRSVSTAGDVNGDGFDDLIIGAYGVDDVVNGSARSDSGEAYVVFGKSSGFSPVLNPSHLDGTNGFRLDGLSHRDHFGESVSTAGDINGDGYDDLLVGAAFAASGSGVGAAYVVFGKASGFPAVVHMSTLNGSTGFRLDGISSSDFFGTSVSAAGDVNGDGLDDLIIGADFADNVVANRNHDQGNSYVIFGSTEAFDASIAPETLNGTNGFRLEGIDIGDHSGLAVSGAGDVNGDGFADLIIGARSAEPGANTGTGEGESYVVFGTNAGFAASVRLSDLNGVNGFRVIGIDPGDGSGVSVSGGGDVNGDGYDDLIIGAQRAEGPAANDGTSTGESYVVFGTGTGFGAEFHLSEIDGTNGIRIDGIAAGDQSGNAVSGAGDVNGDGFGDLIIGAAGAAVTAGESYLVFGGNFTGGVETMVGTNGPDVLISSQGVAAADVLIGGRGGDTLISDGGPDVLIAGNGDDILSIPDADFSGRRRVRGGRGRDTLRVRRASVPVTLNLTSLADNRLTGIEIVDIVDTDNTLTLDVQEVLNLSDTSNTLTVFRSGAATLNRGPGWTQQTNEAVDSRTFEVFTQGAATLRTHTVPTVTLTVSAASAVEDSATDLVYTFTRDVTLGAVSVDFAVSGEATFNSDYTQTGAAAFSAASGTITFADGQATATVIVSPAADNLVELNEAVEFTLMPDPARFYLVGSAGFASGTITDDDTAIFSISDATASEGAGTIQFVLSTSSPVDRHVAVRVEFAGGTATDSNTDFSSTTRTVVFPAGDSSSRTLMVPVTDDDLVELTESFTAAISTTTSLGSRAIDFGGHATGFIADDDTATFTVDDVTVNEGAGVATFTISLDHPLDIPVDIDVSYTDDTATGAPAGHLADFDNHDDTVRFAAGDHADKTVTVTITDDDLIEGPHTFRATLSTNTVFGLRMFDVGGAGIGTISDNDIAGVEISPNTFSVTESGSDSQFSVALTAQPLSNVVLNLESSDLGEAVVTPATFTFTPQTWNEAQTATVTGIEDSAVDGDQVTTLTVAVDDILSDDAFDIIDSQAVSVTTLDNDIGGNIDGDTDFDANDSFLILLWTLAGTDLQISQARGNSPLEAEEIRNRMVSLGLSGDVDGDGDFDANDSFLIHLVKLAGTDAQISQSKGSSLLATPQIRANVDFLGSQAAAASAKSVPGAWRPVFADSTGSNASDREVDGNSTVVLNALFSNATTQDAWQRELQKTAEGETNLRLTLESGSPTVESSSATTGLWTSFRSWIDSI